MLMSRRVMGAPSKIAFGLWGREGTAHFRRLTPPSFAAQNPPRFSSTLMSRRVIGAPSKIADGLWGRGRTAHSRRLTPPSFAALTIADAAFVRGFHEKAGPVKRVRKNLVPASAGLGAPGRSLPLPPIRRFSSASRPGPVKAERSEPPGPALTGGREATIRARRQWQALEACCHCFFFPRFSAGQPRAPCFHSHSPSASRRRGARWGPCC